MISPSQSLRLAFIKPLLGRTFRERRELLKGTFTPRKKNEPPMNMAQFDFVSNCDSEEGRDVVEEFFIKSVESKCEGLMIKVNQFVRTNSLRTNLL